MDRLICGDVGFGKTEVAIRAAFKAVEFGKQVAVLVPTTVLAEQHERTFRARMADYPVPRRVALALQDAQGATHAQGAAPGEVDVVIGTHRLLRGREVRRPGLVVIDEEQRFGVEHKQRLLGVAPHRRRADAQRHAHPAHAAHGDAGPARHQLA
jgi:transcription-repair coupling factor (superfamily II helicase)